MTLSSTTTSVSYTGNGSTTSFAVTFPFLGTGSTAELTVVERTIATGVEVTKDYSTHYTVSGGSVSTGTVVAGSEPADTVQWHIRRNTTTTQTVDYVTNDPFPADTHETALDRLAMAAQERDGDIGQAFKYPDTYTAGASTTMPEPVANAYLVFNSDGDALTTSTTSAAQYLGSDGTASLPFYSFTSDPNSGIYRIGSDNVGLSLGGTKRVDFATAGTAITGTLTTSGVLSVDDTTDTTSGTSGSIHTDGGIGIAKKLFVGGVTTVGDDIVSDTDSTDDLGTNSVRWANLYVDAITTTDNQTIGGNLTVTGNLTINGTTVTNDATNVLVKDPLIGINNGASSNASDLGLLMERGSTGDNAFMGWDESGDFFTVGTTTGTADSTGNLTYSFANFKCAAITATSGTLAGITSLGLNAGATITDGILDEDAMGSNSAVALATQQSIKAYVDNNAPEAGVKFAFESTTTDTDQGAGKVWLNHGTPSSATVVYIDDVEAGGVSVNAWVDTFDDVSNSVARGYLYIASYGSTNAILVYKVTGSVTSASTYSKVAATHVLTVGTISDGDSIGLTFVPSGADGTGDMSDVVDDTSPQLGGDLDVNGQDITSASNADVDINPNGTGNVVLKTDLVSIGGGSEVGHISSNGAYDLKLSTNTDSSSGNITITDGSNGAITMAPNGTGAVVATTSMTIGNAAEIDTKIVFDGHAQDYYIGLDDSADDLVIGLGSAVGTTPAISIDENQMTTFGKAALGATLTDTSNTGSITLDFNTYQNFILTFTGNVTLANPTTESVGQSGFIVIIQDGTGSRTLSLGTDYETAGGSGLTISTTANAVDVVPYIVKAAGSIQLGAPQLAFS